MHDLHNCSERVLSTAYTGLPYIFCLAIEPWYIMRTMFNLSELPSIKCWLLIIQKHTLTGSAAEVHVFSPAIILTLTC